MYILSFYTINALKTQKNGRLLYVPSYGTQYCVPCAQSTRNNITSRNAIRHKSNFVACASHFSFINVSTPLYYASTPLHTFAPSAYPLLTTQKTPIPFGMGAIIIADNINYFSSPIACAMYALFASFAALFASRFTFK